jgi:hypothetical protein
VKTRHCSRPFSSKKLLDPDPISITALVVSIASAAAGITSLFYHLQEVKQRNQQLDRKFAAVVLRAKKTADYLRNAISEFQRICQPAIVKTNHGSFLTWDLNEYEYASLKMLIKQLSNAHIEFSEIQNQIGALDLDKIGDLWRMHSIEGSLRLIKKLSAIETETDIRNIIEDSKKVFDEYWLMMSRLHHMIIDKLDSRFHN